MKKIEDCKMLVLTVDCWSDNTGADTMSSLFSWCRKENLANIYIRADIPTFTGCDHYFQVLESDVIKSIFDKSVQVGKKVSVDDNRREHLIKEKAFYRKFRTHRPWLLLYAREFLWMLGKWETDNLREFILEFDPDYIVFAYEGYIHFNRIVRYAIGLTGAKAVGYFWDDNFTYKQRFGNLGFMFYRFFQRKDIKKTVELSSLNFAITPKTKEECDKTFGINTILLTKPITSKSLMFEEKCTSGETKKILYTGNLGIGRLNTLKVISDALEIVNKEKEYFRLTVFSNTYIPDKIKSQYCESIVFNNSVPKAEIASLQESADILLFLEDICGNNRYTARLSFSTKLTDYFAAGRCILAVAEKSIAPIEYLKEEDAAIIASNKDQLVEAFSRIKSSYSLIDEYAKKAYLLGVKNHSYTSIIKKLKDALTSVQD